MATATENIKARIQTITDELEAVENTDRYHQGYVEGLMAQLERLTKILESGVLEDVDGTGGGTGPWEIDSVGVN